MRRALSILTIVFVFASCSPISEDKKLDNNTNKNDNHINIPIEDSEPPAETINLYYAGKGFTHASSWYGESNIKPWEDINRPHTFQIHVSTSISSMEQHTDFIYNDWVISTKPILDKIRKSHAKSNWSDRSFEYLYDNLQFISLTADKTIGERMAGEELIDLFYITSQNLQFTYPNADMVVTEKFMTLDEWVEKRLLLPIPFGLMPINPFDDSDFQAEINFTVNITLENSGPVLECTFKRCFKLE